MRSEFDEVLKELRAYSPRASDEMFSEVLRRVAVAAPAALPRADLADGRNMPRAVTPLSDGSVSRAVKALLEAGMLCELDQVVERPGRPLKPLRLTPDRWNTIGIYVQTRHGHPSNLVGVLAGLDGEALLACCLSAPAKHALDDVNDFVRACAQLAAQLRDIARDSGARVLGVGIALGGHVNAGTVIDSTPTGWVSVELANRIEELVGLAVVVENDVNALAVGESYSHRYPETDMAVVAVFDEGVGGALIVDGRVYRGGFGMAGEIGHITVEYPPDDLDDGRPPLTPAKPQHKRSFTQPCPPPCGEFGHVDCLAPPVRVRGALREAGLEDLAAATITPADEGTSPTQPGERVFARAGRALGRGIVSLINVANPSRVVVFLPTTFANAEPGTAAARYRSSMESAVSKAFSTGATNARANESHLTVEVIPSTLEELEAEDPSAIDNAAYFMAKEVAWCVLDAFLEHASGRERPEAPSGEDTIRPPAPPHNESATGADRQTVRQDRQVWA